MRNASGALIALLNNQSQYYVADLLTITQANGAVTRLTSADFDVTAVSQVDNASHVFVCNGPKFTRTKTKLIVGLQVDTMTVVLMPDPVLHLLGGIPWPAAAAAGAFDEARIVVEKAIMAKWGDTSAGTLIQFGGRVGQVEASRSTITLPVNSDLELIRALMPRNTYQPGCVHTLFDSGCGLNRATFAVAGVTQAGSTVNQLNTTLANATGYFDQGTITFTSGALTGQSYTVKSFVSATRFTPMRAFAQAPTPGDTFNAYPGCDKLQATCSAKFANLARFRGYPYITSPEAAR